MLAFQSSVPHTFFSSVYLAKSKKILYSRMKSKVIFAVGISLNTQINIYVCVRMHVYSYIYIKMNTHTLAYKKQSS